MQNYDGEMHVNIGTGEDIEIRELANIIKKIVGYSGLLEYDTLKPDGTPRKLLDVSLLHRLGWHHTTALEDGIDKVYRWYAA
jgi:GDP-L-fucose synthase